MWKMKSEPLSTRVSAFLARFAPQLQYCRSYGGLCVATKHRSLFSRLRRKMLWKMFFSGHFMMINEVWVSEEISFFPVLLLAPRRIQGPGKIAETITIGEGSWDYFLFSPEWESSESEKIPNISRLTDRQCFLESVVNRLIKQWRIKPLNYLLVCTQDVRNGRLTYSNHSSVDVSIKRGAWGSWPFPAIWLHDYVSKGGLVFGGSEKNSPPVSDIMTFPSDLRRESTRVGYVNSFSLRGLFWLDGSIEFVWT